MKPSMMILALCVCGMVAGCGPKPPEETLPSVTLVTREPAENMIAMTFVFKNMDRASWKNRVLKAAIVKSGEMPPAGAPEFKDPPNEFAFQLIVAKNSGIETVLFTPSWGPASEGKFLVNGAQIILPAPDGKTNEVTLTGYVEHRISQVVEARGGPGRPVVFDPDKGIDLVTVGYAPDAYCVHLWADKSSE